MFFFYLILHWKILVSYSKFTTTSLHITDFPQSYTNTAKIDNQKEAHGTQWMLYSINDWSIPSFLAGYTTNPMTCEAFEFQANSI